MLTLKTWCEPWIICSKPHTVSCVGIAVFRSQWYIQKRSVALLETMSMNWGIRSGKVTVCNFLMKQYHQSICSSRSCVSVCSHASSYISHLYIHLMLVSYPDSYRTRKKSLVKCVFNFGSVRQHLGAPIRLQNGGDVISVARKRLRRAALHLERDGKSLDRRCRWAGDRWSCQLFMLYQHSWSSSKCDNLRWLGCLYQPRIIMLIALACIMIFIVHRHST